MLAWQARPNLHGTKLQQESPQDKTLKLDAGDAAL
jgi:hypothetical protein